MTRHLLQLLRSNRLSASGAVLTTLAFFAIVTTFLLQVLGILESPYIGIVTFLVLPAVFVLGLGLIPLGLFVYRRTLTERMAAVKHQPLRLLHVLGLLTLVNFAVIGFAGYEGVEQMGTVTFCGVACHGAMQPEYDTYFSSPHARVACVECHVGSGAAGFIESKINGVHQLIAYLGDSYERPILTPLPQQIPADDICGRCHDADQSRAETVRVRRRFADDAGSTEQTTLLLLKVGGRREDGSTHGIHWHSTTGVSVEYVADTRALETIPWVQATYLDGSVRVFRSDGEEGLAPPDGTHRKMDCIDCHNRAAHVFDDPIDAVDQALADGRLPRALPFMKKAALEALHAEDLGRETAVQDLQAYLRGFYRQPPPPDGTGDVVGDDPGIDAPEHLLTQAAEALAQIYRRNVYPDRGVQWGSYPRMNRHAGCLRCHDDSHEDAAGETISMDCDICHVVLDGADFDEEWVHTLASDGR